MLYSLSNKNLNYSNVVLVHCKATVSHCFKTYHFCNTTSLLPNEHRTGKQQIKFEIWIEAETLRNGWALSKLSLALEHK